MNKKSNQIILFFIFLTILSACTSYPTCPPEIGCTTISANEVIRIPIILPLTNINSKIINEQKSAIEDSFNSTIPEDYPFLLEFNDNYDSSLFNQNQLLTFYESPNTPVIISSLSSSQKNQIQHSFINLHVTIPGIYFYINEGLLDISAILPIEQTVLLTSFNHIQHLQSGSFCTAITDKCFPFESSYTDKSIQSLVKNSEVVLLISNLQDINEWMKYLPTTPQQKIIIIDTELSQPQKNPTFSQDVYWHFPDIWFEQNKESINNSDQENWQYALSYWTYPLTQQIFESIKNNLSTQQSGFRLIKSSELQNDMINNIIPPVVFFNLYQFNGTQYIMKTNLN